MVLAGSSQLRLSRLRKASSPRQSTRVESDTHVEERSACMRSDISTFQASSCWSLAVEEPTVFPGSKELATGFKP